MATNTKAIVTYASDKSPKWELESVNLSREIRDDEIKVRMVAAGICHSDVYCSILPSGTLGMSYPKILGHEGAGIVEKTGRNVTVAEPGDPVLLSYDHCDECDNCKSGFPSRCSVFTPLNLAGEKDVFRTMDGSNTAGKFFGQSSFAALSIVSEKSVVNVKGLVNNEELKLLAPLGCGLMTGVGAIMNSASAGARDVILVTGIGAVGLGAIMAAKIAGCKVIIAVDRVASRLKIAEEVGATHILKTDDSNSSLKDLVPPLIENQSITVAIETTGVPTVISEAITCLGKHGKLIQIGGPPLDASIPLLMSEFFFNHKTLTSTVMGDSVSRDMLPKMIQWWRQGKFPVEKLVEFFPASAGPHAALQGMESGAVIKPVFVW